MTSPFDLTGRTALVTGSSRGIGLTIAAGLGEAGGTLVLNGIDAERLELTAAELRERFGRERVHCRAFDVTDEAAVTRAIADLEGSVGAIDICVNNAGIQHRTPMLDLDVADWRRVVEADLTSVFIVGRAVARAMIERGRGKILNLGSVQSELGRPTIAAYTAAKGGVRNLTRAMAAEWGPAGLQINCLAPGYIRTEMTQNLVDDAAFNSWVLGRTPSRRWGDPADLVGPAVWLTSAASDYVNGQTIFVDGGMTVVV